MTVGADYVLNPKLLVGTFVQFDGTRQRSGIQQSDISGTGWLAGSYATVRLSEHVFLQSRAAWGRSSNEVSPFMNYVDKFDSERWLISSTLAGRWTYGPWTLKPAASVSYMQDKALNYQDTFGVAIPEITSGLGQAKVGPQFSYHYLWNPGLVLEPYAGVQLIWNFAGGTTVAGSSALNGDAVGPNGVRGRTELGLRAQSSNGFSLDFSGSYDGIGVGNYSAATGRATLRVPLN